MSTDDSRETLPRPATAAADDTETTRALRSPSPWTEQPAAPPDSGLDAAATGAPGPDGAARAPGPDGAERPSPAGPDRRAASDGGAVAAVRPGSTNVLPGGSRPERPAARPERAAAAPRGAARPTARPTGRGRRARLVLQRVDPWSVFLFSLVASICLGIVLLVAVTALYAALSALGVLGSLNTLFGEVMGGTDGVGAPFFTLGRVLGATAVLAAIDVVLLTVLATLSALLYNLCASLTGGVEVVLGERE